jgi:uncharacterized protein (TIGR02145 family)
MNPLPVATVAAKTVCSGGTVTLSATLGAGTTTPMTYTWNIGGTSSTTSANNNTSQTLTTNTTYTVQLKNSYGCEGSASSPATITINTIPTITTHPASAATCSGNTMRLSVVASNVTGYQWKMNGANVTGGSGATSANYTSGTLSSNATYTVVVGNAACTVTSNAAYVTATGTVPNTTVNFTAFNPCPNAAIGTVWYLTDTRESGVSPSNTQTYKVRKMADGHIWMVQDLKFGNLCGSTFTGSTSNQTDKVTSLTDKTYYGDCTTLTNSDTPDNRGYMYEWAAAINKAGAYYGSSSNVGCSGTATGTSGTNPGACQGICPVGWHIPTSGEYNDAYTKFRSYYSCSNAGCWNASSQWEGVLADACLANGTLVGQGTTATYWSSTYYDAFTAYILLFRADNSLIIGGGSYPKYYARLVRCVMNY